jgi:hypothetical protein
MEIMTNEQKIEKLVKIEFKHKRMPIGYLSAPELEMIIDEIQIDKSYTIKIQPKLIPIYSI